MRSLLYALLFFVVLSGCQQKENGQTYVPRPLSANEDFNQFPKDKTNQLAIFQLGDSAIKKQADRIPKELYHIKFADTPVSIQLNAADKKSVASQFSFAEFLNTQKTALLVQVADTTGLVAPFYILTINNDKLEVVSIYRASSGADDSRYAKGAIRVGRSGYVVNNDYFITTVKAKVYPLTRLKEEERIPGIFFVNSPDKETVVFMMPSSLYEVHYPSGKTFTQPLSGKIPTVSADLLKWIQDSYSWQRNESGISFLKKNVDDNRIIDIKDFK